jgi:hypothetical protein
MSIEELKQKMLQWKAYHNKRYVYDADDPIAIQAQAEIKQLKAEFETAGFEIGFSDFGRLQLILL